MTDQLISADSHMCEPPDLWTRRIDKPFRDRAPRILANPKDLKGSFFVCEDLPPFRVSGAFAAGKTFDKAFMEAGMEDALPGGWDPAERLRDMDEDGIVAEVLYTTCGFVLFWVEDAAFQDACFRAYNDWLAEFVSHDPKRFYGLGLISLIDIDRATRELERCKKAGLSGAMIWAKPPDDMPYSAPEYDRFWAAAQSLEMPLSLHTLTGKGKESQQDESAGVAEIYARMVLRPGEIQHSFLTLVFGGVLERFPELRFVSAEGDVAWIPHILERADKYARRFGKGYDAGPLSLTPTEYFRRQFYACFIDDPLGLAIYHYSGVADNLMWSTDYPHQASTFPQSRKFVDEKFSGVPPADRNKIVCENAAKLYGIDIAS